MKNMSKVKQLIAVLALAVAIAIPVALAQSGEGKGGRHFGHGWGGDGMMGGRMFSQLNLTDAQKAQFKQIRESHSATIQSLRQQIHDQMQAIHQANDGTSFDEAIVSQKLAQIAPLQAKLMGEEFKIHQEMLNVLTPEQKTKLDQLREQFKTRRQEFKTNRGEFKAKKSATSL